RREPRRRHRFSRGHRRRHRYAHVQSRHGHRDADVLLRRRRTGVEAVTPFKTMLLLTLTAAMLSTAPTSAQDEAAASTVPDETADEVIVRGRRLADFRAELEAAQLRI